MYRRALAITLVAILFLPLLPQTTGSLPPINELLEEIKGDAEIIGNGSVTGMRIGGTEAGVIYGDRQEGGAPFVYVSGTRLMAMCEERDGDRITSKSFITEKEYFFVGVYRIIEYRDTNNNSVFDGTSSGYAYHLVGSDSPVGGTSMNLSWNQKHSIVIENDRTVLQTTTLSYAKPKEDLIWNDYTGQMEEHRGSIIADGISINITINMSYGKAEKEVPDSLCSETYGKSAGTEGTEVSLNIGFNYTVDHWNFRYPDSKIMVQAVLGVYHETGAPGGGYIVNITTSSPRYLEIDNSTEILFPRPAYGRSQRIHTGERDMVCDIRGNRYAIGDGENETYGTRVQGTGANMPEPEHMCGFSTISESTYQQDNTTQSGMSITTGYFTPFEFRRTDATAGWLVYLAFFESGAVALGAVAYSYKRHRHR